MSVTTRAYSLEPSSSKASSAVAAVSHECSCENSSKRTSSSVSSSSTSNSEGTRVLRYGLTFTRENKKRCSCEAGTGYCVKLGYVKGARDFRPGGLCRHPPRPGGP